MDWYLPFTLLSGVGLLVLSTSNFINGLNSEITQMEAEKQQPHLVVIASKLSQLRLLSIAIALQYISLFLFTLTSIILAFMTHKEGLTRVIILLGVCILSVALGMLIFFAIRAVGIRQKHLKIID